MEQSTTETERTEGFTPGPWRLSFDVPLGAYYIAPIEATIPAAPIEAESEAEVREFAKEQGLNGLLIAAAPEMYEALRVARRHTEEAQRLYGVMGDGIIAMIDEVLAKARGGVTNG